MSIESQMSGLIGPIPDGISEGVALGTGLADGYDLYESAIGEVLVAFNLDGVSSVDLANDNFEERFALRFGRHLLRAEAPRAWRSHIPSAIEAGTPGRVPVDLRSVTPFQASILHVTATIPRGEVRSYGWLAREVERPKATRAAGSVMARNPVPLIIPCHRVVRADGHLGNYSLGGPHIKHDLLDHEGADPEWLEDLAARNVRVRAHTGTQIYCHPTCHVVRNSSAESIVDFRSSSEAAHAGFQPCELCRPGE